MKIPTFEPTAKRSNLSLISASHAGLTPQGCNWFACAAAVAQCVSNPDPKQCILNIAPNCLACL